MSMKSSDEDLELFLTDFMNLLNKYHYNLDHKFRLGKFADEESKIIAFQADGNFMWMVAQVDGNFYRMTRDKEENSGK